MYWKLLNISQYTYVPIVTDDLKISVVFEAINLPSSNTVLYRPRSSFICMDPCLGIYYCRKHDIKFNDIASRFQILDKFETEMSRATPGGRVSIHLRLHYYISNFKFRLHFKFQISNTFQFQISNFDYITPFHHFKCHLHLKWPVVHQQLHMLGIYTKYSPPAQHAG